MPPDFPMRLSDWLAASLLLPLRRLPDLARPLVLYGVPAMLIELMAMPVAAGAGLLGGFALQLVSWFFWAALGVRVVRLALFDKPATPRFFVREDANAYLVMVVILTVQLAFALALQPFVPEQAAIESGTADVPGGALILMLALLAAVFYAGIRFLFAYPAAASGAPSPFVTSWNLTRGVFWPILGWTLLLVLALTLVLSMLLQFLAGGGGEPGLGALIAIRVYTTYMWMSLSVGLALLFGNYAPPAGIAQLRERVASE